MHYAVLPALARNKLPDPVFFFAGGPGQSAIEIAATVGAMLGRFSNRRDIVLIDQRGVGRSAPLVCEADDPARPLAEAFDMNRQREQLDRCLNELRALPYGDLRFFTTPIAIADADAVRAALGAPKINLVGGSYGTRAALEYMRQFPQHVRRVVIDGVAPPDMVLPAALSSDNQAALDLLLAACTQEPACSAREPRLTERWRALLASLPRKVAIVHPLTGSSESDRADARDAARHGARAAVRAGAGVALPSAIGEATHGRFEPLASLAMAFGGRRGTQMAAGMHFAVDLRRRLSRA